MSEKASQFKPICNLRLDERGRISLTKLLDNLPEHLKRIRGEMQFQLSLDDSGRALLTPMILVPMHEAWLYQNPQAFAQVVEGLKQAEEGNLVDLGSFAQHADDNIE